MGYGYFYFFWLIFFFWMRLYAWYLCKNVDFSEDFGGVVCVFFLRYYLEIGVNCGLEKK